MRNILIVSWLLCSPLVLANNPTAAPAEALDSARCEQLRQLATPDPAAQQLLQQCTALTSAGSVMPVQLELAQPLPAGPPPKVQHNTTLEWLGSSMLLVLLGFWLWMSRR